MVTIPTDIVKSGQYTGRSQTLQINNARTAELVSMAAEEMLRVNSKEKIPLCDIEMVQAASQEYLVACAKHGVMPTVRGCAAYFGLTRNALYNFARDHRGSAFQEWLQNFSDICGELLMQSAIEGTASPVPAIFVAKARYGWRENEEMPVQDAGPPELTPEEIAAKYADLLPE